jgi:hypothetical protein
MTGDRSKLLRIDVRWSLLALEVPSNHGSDHSVENEIATKFEYGDQDNVPCIRGVRDTGNRGGPQNDKSSWADEVDRKQMRQHEPKDYPKAAGGQEPTHKPFRCFVHVRSDCGAGRNAESR